MKLGFSLANNILLSLLLLVAACHGILCQDAGQGRPACDQILQIVFDNCNCPAVAKVRAWVWLAPIDKPSNYRYRVGVFYTGNQAKSKTQCRGSIVLPSAWIQEHAENKFRIFVVPVIRTFDGKPHDTTYSGMSEELTMKQLLACCIPDENQNTNEVTKKQHDSYANAYHLTVTMHRYLRDQTVLLLDANGAPVESDGWEVVASAPGKFSTELRQATGSFRGINGPVKQTPPLEFRLYSGLQYSIHMNSIYADAEYDSPPVLAEDLAKLKPWKPQCPLERYRFRLLDAQTKQTPSVFDPGKPRQRAILLVSSAPDTARINMRKIPLSSDGTATYGEQAMSFCRNWETMYVHAVACEDPNTSRLVSFFKHLTPFHKFDRTKKVHNIDILVEPVADGQTLIPETVLDITDKTTGNAVANARVYALEPPYQRLKASDPLPLKPGKHKLLIYANGYRLQETLVTIGTEGKRTEKLALEPLKAPVTVLFAAPSSPRTDKLEIKLRYDNYPCLGVISLPAVNWREGDPSVPDAMNRHEYRNPQKENGTWEIFGAIDDSQPFTLCANAMRKPERDAMRISQELPLMLFRHGKGPLARSQVELKVPPYVVWKGKIDLAAAGADDATVIWARKVEGLPDAPLAAGTMTKDGICTVPLEPGQTYGRYVMLTGKDHKNRDAYRSLPPYTVPADAKELPEETLTPGPAGSGVPVRNKIGGWMF